MGRRRGFWSVISRIEGAPVENVRVPEEAAMEDVVEDGQLYVKTEVLRRLPGIVPKMLEDAAEGKPGNLKLLWQLGGMDKDATAGRKSRGPTLLELLMGDPEEPGGGAGSKEVR